ncbi:MAG: 50S ribosomal protein L6 [bacterium]
MSRIGKKPIEISEGIEVKVDEQKVFVKGPKGEISREFRPEFKISAQGNKILVEPLSEKKGVKALWGTTRAILANMVKGVQSGFEKKLEIEGLGFKAIIVGQDLELSLGFSHPVKIKALDGVKFSVEKNIITVSGIDIEKVSKIAALIKRARPPEPYKGKGIRYQGEFVRRKEGKKATAAAK